MIDELKKAEEQLQEAIKKRSDRYKLIQDMTVSAIETEGIMKGIKILTSQITSFQRNVNTIKKLMGYHQDEIKKTELKKKTII
jgi:prefoldin subunit 5